MEARNYLATNVFDADGQRTDWPFSFAGVKSDNSNGTTPYLSPSDVKCEEISIDSNDVITVTPREGQLIASNVLRVLGAPVANGNLVRIFRVTERRYPLVDYKDRQAVTESDLDLANRQAILLAQEAYDATQGADANSSMSHILFLTREALAEAERIADEFGDLDSAMAIITDAATRAAVSRDEAAGFAAAANGFARDAQTWALAAAASGRIYDTIYIGLANTINGQYFYTVSPLDSEELILWLNSAGVAVERKRTLSKNVDALTINAGKVYPWVPITRFGVLPTESKMFNEVFLHVTVQGSFVDLNKYHVRIPYFQNGAAINGVAGNGCIVELLDKATAATVGTAESIHGYRDGNTGINRAAGGIQTIVIRPAKRADMLITVTLNVDKMPPYGTTMSALESTREHYSHVIHPSCMLPQPSAGEGEPVNSLTINGGKVYPLRKISRNNVNSADNAVFNAAILGASVEGARDGRYYRVEYFLNRNPALPNGPRDGWIINEYLQENYETADNPATLVHTLADPAPSFPREGIQTIRLPSTRVAGVVVTLIVDASKFPALGTSVPANFPHQQGYSHIIDPSCYHPAVEGGSVTPLPPSNGPLYVTKIGNTVQVAWAGYDKCIRMNWELVGVNQLPNLLGIDTAPGTDVEKAVWVVANTTGSDYLPPLQLRAVLNGDSGGIAFTGGSHGSTGGAAGDPTARNVLFDVMVDGTRLPKTGTVTTRAERVTFFISNELMGWNTKETGRYIADQNFRVDIRRNGCVVHGALHAKEDIAVVTDYGLQLITFGYRDGTQFILGGNRPRELFDMDYTPGNKSESPNAWAYLINSPVHGQATLWMDHSYGVGKGDHVDNNMPLLFTSNLGKAYLGAVRSAAGKVFTKGTGYKYRAGLTYQSPNHPIVPGTDSVVELPYTSGDSRAIGYSDASFVIT